MTRGMKKAITLFAFVKKSKNQAGMVVRTRGTKKQEKSGRRLFRFGSIGGVVFRQSGVDGSKSAPNWNLGSLPLLLHRGEKTRKSRTMARRRGSPEEEEEEEKGLTESLDRERFVSATNGSIELLASPTSGARVGEEGRKRFDSARRRETRFRRSGERRGAAQCDAERRGAVRRGAARSGAERRRRN